MHTRTAVVREGLWRVHKPTTLHQRENRQQTAECTRVSGPPPNSPNVPKRTRQDSPAHRRAPAYPPPPHLPLSFFTLLSAFNGAALTAAKPASSAMKMSFESEVGAQAPIGYWDPLGLLTKDPTQVSPVGEERQGQRQHSAICSKLRMGDVSCCLADSPRFLFSKFPSNSGLGLSSVCMPGVYKLVFM